MIVVATVNGFCPACKIWCEDSSPSTESTVRSEVETPVTQKEPQDGLSTCPNPRSLNASAGEDPVEQNPGASRPGRSASPTARLLQGSTASSAATTPVNVAMDVPNSQDPTGGERLSLAQQNEVEHEQQQQ
ncbi:MAG: hypothetical protein Q9172_005684 [Xanthocarpia lactea]